MAAYEPGQGADRDAIVKQYELTEAEQRDLTLSIVTRIAVRHI